MGGAVSSGRNNDDLIDNLLEADYIRTSLVERVFRAVDRAEYFLPEARADAYKDLAWKKGNLHLSAPCIYSEVMEGLCLERGLSFLNLGSGTGYLSTMVGLILGSTGINHGIEIHENVVQYANKKLEEFKRFSGAVDEFDFCEPKFIQGNCLCLVDESSVKYDRIYCGAACPEHYDRYIKTSLKIGGILVMPLNEQLLQIKRTSETEWSVRPLLPVSFASLIVPSANNRLNVEQMDCEPLSLQLMCRSVIRDILRRNIEVEHPPIKKAMGTAKAPKKKRALKHLVVPVFDSDSDSEEEPHVSLVGNSGRALFNRDDNIVTFFLGLGNGRSPFSSNHSGNNQQPSNDTNTNTKEESETETVDQAMETETNESADEGSSASNERPTTQTCRAVIEHLPDIDEGAQNQDQAEEPRDQAEEPSLEAINDINDVIFECLNVLRRDRQQLANEVSDENSDAASEEAEENQASASTSGNPAQNETRVDNKRKSQREKVDSGLGDEIVETQDSSDDDDDEDKLDALSSCDDEVTKKRNKRGELKSSASRESARTDRHKLMRRMQIHQNLFSDSSSEVELDPESKPDENEMRMYQSPYTEHMKAKIQQLPLPTILKKYLNFYREF